MTDLSHKALDRFLEISPKREKDGVLREFMDADLGPAEIFRKILDRYHFATSSLEKILSEAGYPAPLLTLYHDLFREMERNLSMVDTDDTRFDFVIVTPVADRPRHLESCLDSLLQLCRLFQYGGMQNGRFKKISVVIADDSMQTENIRHNRELVERYQGKGLDTEYFGQREQREILDALPKPLRSRLNTIVGNHPPHRFHHKGASITRNITYLKLNGMRRVHDRTLFWFLDSDQEFRVSTLDSKTPVYAINYFHRLNQTFSNPAIQVLTGKVVGDPPVSPSVMANTLLEDVLALLSHLEKLEPQQPCPFHQSAPKERGESYHDMAELFGLNTANAPFEYPCPVEGRHSALDCLDDFASRLNAFFDGQHPTRQTYYEYRDFTETLTPARTVYTGNYVLTPGALQHFVPFATLKLRMAGPTLGRLLQSQLRSGFVSANLPMLHRRTVDDTGRSEFRPGVEHQGAIADLAGEFERQFFGDVMLFSMERLVGNGYPQTALADAAVRAIVAQTEQDLSATYRQKRTQIQHKLKRLHLFLSDATNGWRDALPGTTAANLNGFMQNMEFNFGQNAKGYRLIREDAHRRQRLEQIVAAIRQLPDEIPAWQDALSRCG